MSFERVARIAVATFFSSSLLCIFNLLPYLPELRPTDGKYFELNTKPMGVEIGSKREIQSIAHM
jgi:hypothetical protein